MNLFFMGLIYPNEIFTDIQQSCKTGMQLQLDNFQKLLIAGMKQNPLLSNIHIYNALPVGSFPKHYSDVFVPSYKNFELVSREFINLPYIKQKMRENKAKKDLLEWVKADKLNRYVLLYSLYLPFMKAIVEIKKDYPDLIATTIVPDIPNEFGLSSGNTGVFASVENSMGKQSMELCQYFDSFVLLTKHMCELLPVQNASYTVVEAIAPDSYEIPNREDIQGCYDKYGIPNSKPVVLYTGTVQRELGILELVEDFKKDSLMDVNLIICGSGNMENELIDICRSTSNIFYLGFIPREDALLLQAGADILINPRKPQGVYTRYSFPSKSMEYLLSAKPVLCYKLEGIPSEYDEYFNYININEGLPSKIKQMLAIQPSSLKESGLKARWFVLSNKNARAQGKKVLELLISTANNKKL